MKYFFDAISFNIYYTRLIKRVAHIYSTINPKKTSSAIINKDTDCLFSLINLSIQRKFRFKLTRRELS